MEWENYSDKTAGLTVIDFNVVVRMYNYYCTLWVMQLRLGTAISN
jgi:hypothetical protein